MKDKAIKITPEAYFKIIKIKKKTRFPIKYIVEFAIDVYIEEMKKQK